MKLKYYLRGLGIGIIVTTLILMISFSLRDNTMPDDEVIARAAQLGMIMPEADTEQMAANTEDLEVTELTEATETEAAETETDETESWQIDENQPADEVVQTPYILTVNKGDVCRIVCENLAANGVVDDAEAFQNYLLDIGYASSIKVGNYEIPYQLTHEEIAQILKAGPIAE